MSPYRESHLVDHIVFAERGDRVPCLCISRFRRLRRPEGTGARPVGEEAGIDPGAAACCVLSSALATGAEERTTRLTYRETFLRLADHDIYSPEFATRIAASAGLRNILVHEYNDMITGSCTGRSEPH